MRSLTLCVYAGAALALLSSPALAQEAPSSAEEANQRPARSINLRQVLDVVVQQNPELARAQVGIAEADASSLAAAGLDDWTVGASGTGSISRTEFVDGQPFQTTSSDSVDLSADVTRPLTSGGTLGVSVGGGFSKSTFAVLADGGQSLEFDSKAWSSSVTAIFTQPLLAGRGKRIARASQRRAGTVRDAATLQQQVAAAAAVRDVINAYWEVAYARRVVDIRKGALDLAKEQLRITEAAIAAKIAARTEALATRQAIAVREQAVLLAEIEVSERSLELRRLAGLEIGPGEIDLAVTDALGDDGRRIDLDAALRQARERNPRLALARLNQDTARIDLEVAEDGLRPRLDLTASAGPSGNATDASDALRQMATFDAFSATAGLTYSHTLGRRAARGNRDLARESSRRLRIDLADAEREISVAVVRAVNRLRSARKRIEVSDLAIQLAVQNLDTEKRLFEAGTVRSFDVLERQDELAQDQLNRERAMVDYLEAVAELESLTGELLTRHNIELMPR